MVSREFMRWFEGFRAGVIASNPNLWGIMNELEERLIKENAQEPELAAPPKKVAQSQQGLAKGLSGGQSRSFDDIFSLSKAKKTPFPRTSVVTPDFLQPPPFRDGGLGEEFTKAEDLETLPPELQSMLRAFLGKDPDEPWEDEDLNGVVIVGSKKPFPGGSGGGNLGGLGGSLH